MTAKHKAVEPYTDEELKDLSQFLELPNRREGFDLSYSAATAKLQNWGFVDGGKTPRRLLATIEAYREKLAEKDARIAELKQWLSYCNDKVMPDLQAAEARVSELEKELSDLAQAVITLDPLGGEHIYVMALQARAKLQAIPTPPEEEAK